MLHQNTRALWLVAAFTTLLIAEGCKDNPVVADLVPDYTTNGRISITNNPSTLNARVRYFADTDVLIDTSVVPSGKLGKRLAVFQLKLRAEVTPPISGEQHCRQPMSFSLETMRT